MRNITNHPPTNTCNVLPQVKPFIAFSFCFGTKKPRRDHSGSMTLLADDQRCSLTAKTTNIGRQQQNTQLGKSHTSMSCCITHHNCIQPISQVSYTTVTITSNIIFSYNSFSFSPWYSWGRI